MSLGATYYDNRRGETMYPVRPGFVLRYTDPMKDYNGQIGAVVEHHKFVWVLSLSPRRRGDRAQDRLVQVCICLVPMLAGAEWKIRLQQKWWRVRSLTKALRRGYVIVADDVKWHRTKRSAKRFYRAIEEHLGVKLL